MKRILHLILLCGICVGAFGQSKEFENVFRACRLAQSSMSDGVGSQSEIIEACSLLTSTEWSPLILQQDSKKFEAAMKNHMVFSPKFLKDVADNRKVYKKAKQYAEEQNAQQRGGNVQLCTKCIKAKQKMTYYIRGNGKPINIAAVAEINGLINLNVIVKDGKGKETPYKINSDEYKGASARRLPTINLPKGYSYVYITIENKTDKDKSVAIIVE
jgi:hypothetical protein